MGVISIEKLEELLSDVEVPILNTHGKTSHKRAKASPREIFRNYASVIRPGTRGKLAASMATGDRSKVLWRLTCQLLEAGLSPGEIVVLVEKTVWNKFGEDRSRLWADVTRAASKVGATASQPRPHSNEQAKTRSEPWSIALDRYLSLESRDPQWMIEGLWSDKSHGIIAAEPKARKSYLAIDIALSVATGTHCLDYFPVRQWGPVLMVQEEISDAEMKKRLRYIAASKHLEGKVHKVEDMIRVTMPSPIPMYLRNRQGFNLTNTDHLEELNREIVDRAIKLLILDPLQWMLGDADENKAHEVRTILRNLLKLKEATGTGIIIAHHYGKDADRKGGRRMLGSQAFHGWVESALYLTKPEPHVTEVEREFRNFDPMPNFQIEYAGGNEEYTVQVLEEKPTKRKPKMTKFERWCIKHPNTPVKRLAQALNTNDNNIRRRVERSPYLEIRSKRLNATGRPVSVIARAKTT